MKTLVVCKKEGNKIADEAEWINVEEILFTEPERIKGEIRTVIHTHNGQYVYCTGNDQLLSLLSKNTDFFITDRGRIANLNKLDKIDYDNRKIIYRNNDFVTIAASRLKSLREYISNLIRK